MHTHTRTHTHTHKYICTHRYVHTWTHIHTHTCAYLHVHIVASTTLNNSATWVSYNHRFIPFSTLLFHPTVPPYIPFQWLETPNTVYNEPRMSTYSCYIPPQTPPCTFDALTSSPGIFYETLMHHATCSGSPHNALLGIRMYVMYFTQSTWKVWSDEMVRLKVQLRWCCAVLHLSHPQISERSKSLGCWCACCPLSPLSCCWAVNRLPYLSTCSGIIFYREGITSVTCP